ncbi:hypothetical protein QBC38DRAFT_215709 [Podospora fimiseda]|uniref:Uncharacterized protein n=1 Tax=Podospora fimiseda TaxID=252190 RepID=A0AAN7BNV8_9PEZI|nr:hypothetical protein QBC38DRAFT_215709 [Podospora fimiseda]
MILAFFFPLSPGLVLAGCKGQMNHFYFFVYDFYLFSCFFLPSLVVVGLSCFSSLSFSCLSPAFPPQTRPRQIISSPLPLSQDLSPGHRIPSNASSLGCRLGGQHRSFGIYFQAIILPQFWRKQHTETPGLSLSLSQRELEQYFHTETSINSLQLSLVH